MNHPRTEKQRAKAKATLLEKNQHALHAFVSRNRKLVKDCAPGYALVGILKGRWRLSWDPTGHGPLDGVTGIVCSALSSNTSEDCALSADNIRFTTMREEQIGRVQSVWAVPDTRLGRENNTTTANREAKFFKILSRDFGTTFLELILRSKSYKSARDSRWHHFDIREEPPSGLLLRRFVVFLSPGQAEDFDRSVLRHYEEQAGPPELDATQTPVPWEIRWAEYKRARRQSRIVTYSTRHR